MTQPNQDPFEKELSRLRPATPPPEFMARLSAARPFKEPVFSDAASSSWLAESWRRLVLWFAPATALAALGAGLLISQFYAPSLEAPAEVATGSAEKALRADNVQIERQLIASFDAVVRMPGGEPVRFRCREWVEEVIFQDTAQGIVIEQHLPRFEAVPVRFETF